MEQYDIALLGGDARTAYMIPYLLEKGYRIISYGLAVGKNVSDCIMEATSLKAAVEGSRFLVGGIPFSKDGKIFSRQLLPDIQMEEWYHLLRPGLTVFGGVLPEEMTKLCEEKGIRCYDFMKSEPLAIKNAIATAEGCILEALSHKDTNLHGSPMLVLGYGRCGSVLARKLRGLDACVSVCSRCDRELAYAQTCGMHTLGLDELSQHIGESAYIFNTVPAKVLSKDILPKVRRDALIIDIASAPGGVDDEEARKLGIEVLHCYGLPGKYAPKAAAKDLADYVIEKIEK